MNNYISAKYPVVEIIIVNWNGLPDTIECIASMKKITYPNYKITVVDNGSAGNDSAMLEQEFGDYIDVIKSTRNLGFTGGCNIGIRQALDKGSDYVLLLNNDTVVASDFLSEMIKAAESDKEVGIAGAKIYNYGTNQIQFVWGGIDFYRGQPTYTPKYVIERFREGPIDKGQYDDLKYVDWASGCSLLIKSDLIKTIGVLDETFFALLEEVEYCTRARKSGYKVVYVPAAKVWHKWGKSTGVVSGFTVYYGTRNRFWLMKKYASKWQHCCFNIYFFGLYTWFAVAYYMLFARNPRIVIDLFHGIRDGVAGSNIYAPEILPDQ